MPSFQSTDQFLHDVLTNARVIAVVGHSNKPDRTSYRIAQFLRQVGYVVYPVNPLVKEIDGQPSYASLQEVPEPVDIVNVFRRSEYLPEVVEEAIALWQSSQQPNHKTIWAQSGIFHPEAAQQAIDAGLQMVMDACIKVEYLRLGVQRG